MLFQDALPEKSDVGGIRASIAEVIVGQSEWRRERSSVGRWSFALSPGRGVSSAHRSSSRSVGASASFKPPNRATAWLPSAIRLASFAQPGVVADQRRDMPCQLRIEPHDAVGANGEVCGVERLRLHELKLTA